VKWLDFHPRRFWSAERGLTALLFFLCFLFIAQYPLSHFSFGPILAKLVFSLVILAGVLATFAHPWVRAGAISLAVAALAVTWVAEVRPGGLVFVVRTGLGLIYLGFLLAVVMVQVFQPGTVTSHRIRGAIVAYLLFGLAWGTAYQFLALINPGAFQLPANVSADDPDALTRALTYFSFITLTTVGYGDIIPIHPLARLLTMSEALVGQLYPVVTLARLVSLEILHRTERH